MADACFSTQLIDGDGVFNVSGLEDFMKQVKLGECGLSYVVVSIMGPQSSGMEFFPFLIVSILFSEYYIWSDEPSRPICCRKEYTSEPSFWHQF